MSRRPEPAASGTAHARTASPRTTCRSRAGTRGRPGTEPAAGSRAGRGSAGATAQRDEDRNVAAAMGGRTTVGASGRSRGVGRARVAAEISAASEVLVGIPLLRRDPILFLRELIACRLRATVTSLEHQRRGDEHQPDLFGKAVHRKFRGNGMEWRGERLIAPRAPRRKRYPTAVRRPRWPPPRSSPSIPSAR